MFSKQTCVFFKPTSATVMAFGCGRFHVLAWCRSRRPKASGERTRGMACNRSQDRAERDSNFYVEVIAPSANSADPAKTAVQIQSRNDRLVRFHDLLGDPLRFLPGPLITEDANPTRVNCPEAAPVDLCCQPPGNGCRVAAPRRSEPGLTPEPFFRLFAEKIQQYHAVKRLKW
jgi:hypothetical protein